MRKTVILLGVLCLQQAYAQQEGKVGVNTENPSATLNVKSKTGTTASTKNLELENAKGNKLVTVLDNGNVGVGTSSPSVKLDVVSDTQGKAFRMADGSQGEYRVLTSDANGNATWKYIAFSVIRGKLGDGVNVPSTSSYLNTGSTITLPANSKWEVIATQLLLTTTGRSTGTIWVRSSFADSPNSLRRTNDIEGSPYISGLLPKDALYNLLTGRVVIHNKSNSPKTYYYIVGYTDHYNTDQELRMFGGKAWGENSITAIQIQD